MDNSQNNNQNKPGQLQLELSPEVATGTYSNFAIISHSSSEFVIDFATMLPGLSKAQVCNRVLLAPEHAKRLLMALQENVMKYENEFGTIKMPHQAPRTIAPFGPKGDA